MKITYTRVGDYYLPNLAAPESPKVGRWGMLRFNYLINYVNQSQFPLRNCTPLRATLTRSSTTKKWRH